MSDNGINRGSSLGLSFVNFKADRSSYLNITSLSTDRVDFDEECPFACLEIPSCFSYNLAIFREVDGKLLCELLPSDKYNNSEMLVHSDRFNHFSIPVSRT